MMTQTPLPLPTVHRAAPSTTASGLLGHLVAGLQGPLMAVVRATLLQPLQLSPTLTHAWQVTRGIALGLLLVGLLYGVLRAQAGALFGVETAAPWVLVPRVLLAALGVECSLVLVQGLLAINNAFCQAILQLAPRGPSGLLSPLAAGLAATAVPAALGLGPALTALLVLIGVAILAGFYLLRAAEIALLTLLLPLAAALWVVPAAAGVYQALFAELLTSIFVQAVQVCVLLVFASGVSGVVTGTSWLSAVAALALLFRCRHLVAGLIGARARWAAEPVRGGLWQAAATVVRRAA